MKVTCRVVCDFLDKSNNKYLSERNVERTDWHYYDPQFFKRIYKLQIVTVKTDPDDSVTVLSERVIESLDDKIYFISFVNVAYEWDTKRDFLYTRQLELDI